jgi:hypothetical protein
MRQSYTKLKEFIPNCGVTTSLGELLADCEAVNTSHSYFKTVAMHLAGCVERRLITETLGRRPRSELAANVRDCVAVPASPCRL